MDSAVPAMLDAALAYARRGWPVFPCDPRVDAPGTPPAKKRSKRPLVPGADKVAGKPVPQTGGLWRATTDEAQIRAWWKRHPRALIGVPTGTRIGAFVIDLDPDGEAVGETEARLVAAVGDLPAGPRSRTQSGGLHIWFALPTGEAETPKNSAKRLRNIDWRGDGGYVIVPPSCMANGARYEWIAPLDAIDLPDAPAALLDLVYQRNAFARELRHGPRGEDPAAAASPAARPRAAEDPGDKAVRSYVRAALDRAARDVAAAAKGTRGFTLNREAFGIAPFVALGVLSEREVIAALQDAADASGLTAEDGDRERDAKIRRGLDAGAGNTAAASARLDEIASEAQRKAGKRRPPPPSSPADYGQAAAPSTPTARPAVASVYSVDAMNSEYAVVLLGGTGLIVREVPGAPASERLRFLKPAAFHLLHENRFVERVDQDGKAKFVTWSNAWLKEARRRTFDGITFHPGDDAPTGYLNLWRGFAVRPKPGGSYAVFRDHLINNVCDGNNRHARWLFAWVAQMFQRPREKPGTAVVMRGPMGSGKTIVGEVVGSLLPDHYFLIDDPRYIVGNFNTHLAACLLLQADEAVWAGDKTAEGRLKGLVTATSQMIESKGVDPVRLPNFVRVLMTSNEDWVVPAGKDERRFAVFDVNARCAQNHGYFAEMAAELDAGGREALLHDLLAFDLSTVNLREIPRTAALLEQKVRSLDPIETWLLDRLKAGTPTRKHDGWHEYVTVDAIVEDYIHASEQTGIRRKAAATAFGMKMARLLPDVRRVRRTIHADEASAARRAWVYELPPLVACRDQFAALMGQAIDWGETDE